MGGADDAVWVAMAEKGLVKAREGGKGVVGERSGRWPAEDSFA
jgi:hypothetical protein